MKPKEEPTDEQQLSAVDTTVLEQISQIAEKGSNVLFDSEKEFLVKELRRIQGDVNTKPRKQDILAIIEKGRSANPTKLIEKAVLDEKQYYGVIERFFIKFVNAANKHAAEL